MTPESVTEHRTRQIKNFRERANMLASAHSILSDRYGTWHSIISSVLLFISSVLIGLTFISEQFVQSTTGVSPDTLKWIVGTVSILSFSGVLLLSQWNFEEKATTHREAVRFYFKIANRIRQWQDSGIEITDEMIEQVRTEYSRTETLPKIPDGQFLKLKQQHLQKVALSRELDSAPFESISSIQKRLETKQKDAS